MLAGMDASVNDVLRHLLIGRSIAALGTLHEGRPFVSMVPFAVHLDAGRLRLVAHVSRLAAHTRDMLGSPEVCLMVAAAESQEIPPQAVARVSIPAVVEFVPPEHPDHAGLKTAYLAKFPDAAMLFQLGDFSIVAFEPTSARLVAGFARAMTLSPEKLAEAVTPSRAS